MVVGYGENKFKKDNKLLEYKNNTICRKNYYEGIDTTIYQNFKTWLEDYPNRLVLNH